MRQFRKGQRWISESEPELGIGAVVEAKAGSLFVLFPASATMRQYAIGSAPVKRVEFRPGDTIKTHSGEEYKVTAVGEGADGILHYDCEGKDIPETDLSDTISFCKPEERLLIGQLDSSGTFDLRHEAHQRRNQIRSSPVRGLIGGRIELIPHQLYIAQEVANRLLPRVLLADEVGLGKTIEACLILHRLHRSGRAGRILVLVPEPLIHQWFVELLRRFNLRVSIFDEERCDAIETNDPDGNPFLDDQLILCSVEWVSNSAERGKQIVEAGWDLLVVDEAHHLGWSPEAASPEYALVSALAASIPGVILLTATPEQFGLEGHFARLQLLDPQRYSDLAKFNVEHEGYEKAAKLAAKLLEEKPLTPADVKALKQICPSDPKRLESRIAAVKKNDVESKNSLVQELVDQHGPGRVMFRNTRAAIKGFPKRKLDLIQLESDGSKDPRIEWLVGFIRKSKSAKILLICRTKGKALELDESLREKINIKVGLFHEDLTLLQRDRNAAWFSQNDGAQLLICSEIGSEGRNFQFAHHLVLFDLPDNPELLEQRIGRLDRIGQTETIVIHVPCPAGSEMEVLARWYHEGLNAFEKSLQGGREILGEFRKELNIALKNPAKLEELISKTKTRHAHLVKEIEKGRNQLLQLNACRPEVAATIVSAIQAWDEDQSLDKFVLGMFDHFGLQVEELADRTWRMVPADLTTDAFPEIPVEGITLTSDRTKALSREEIGFLTWDHPILTGALDLFLASEQGNSSFVIWSGGDEPGMYLEAIFILETVAPPALHADRFLPPTPIRIVIDAKGETCELALKPSQLKDGPIFKLLDNSRIKNRIIPLMLDRARTAAEAQAKTLIEQANLRMHRTLGHELERLSDLRKVNDHIREEELVQLRGQQEALQTRLVDSPTRLDALRLVWAPGKGSA